jgi:hypothetical protein
MRDEIYDRGYQAGRHELHAGIDRALSRLGTAVLTTFEAIHRVEFSAPWKRTSKKDCTGIA